MRPCRRRIGIPLAAIEPSASLGRIWNAGCGNEKVWRGGFYVPKTKRSKRKIDVGDQLLGVLAGWRRERYGEAALPPDPLIFPGGDGGPLDLDAVRKRVGPALAKAGSGTCGSTASATRSRPC
jgi:hypothetical protein